MIYVKLESVNLPETETNKRSHVVRGLVYHLTNNIKEK